MSRPPLLRPQLAFLLWAAIVLLTYGLSILLLRGSIKPVRWLALPWATTSAHSWRGLLALAACLNTAHLCTPHAGV